jgi:hypothetical protein
MSCGLVLTISKKKGRAFRPNSPIAYHPILLSLKKALVRKDMKFLTMSSDLHTDKPGTVPARWGYMQSLFGTLDSKTSHHMDARHPLGSLLAGRSHLT